MTLRTDSPEGKALTTFDPDIYDLVEVDDRPERVVKAPNPVRQKRNRGNKQRGKRAERKWADAINELLREGEPQAEVRGALGGADVTWRDYAFEVKQRRGEWPSNTTIKDAIVQAAANAGWRVPVVVACKTSHKSTEWRVFRNRFDEYQDGLEWLRPRTFWS